MKNKVEPGVYRHHKGTEYCVYGIVIHTETMEPLVLYGEGVMKWVRPIEHFLSTVELEDGTVVNRFEKVKIA